MIKLRNPFSITDTFELLPVVERIKQPASYLVDVFFPNIMPVSNSSYVAVEYRKEGRQLAPYVVKHGRGVNVARSSSRINLYQAPMVAPRRVIGLADIELRQFGETPVFSTLTPAERAAKMQADDLTELLRMIQNRKNKQAADILQTGKTTIKGLADDGQTVVEDEIFFDWSGQVNASIDWSSPTADVYGDIKGVSERIQEESGYIPTLMICGKNVGKKVLANKQIYDWLLIPSRENLFMANFSPQFVTPQVQRIGRLEALNLEIVSYSETFMDDDGQVKSFIDPDAAIICVPNLGKQLYGAVSFMDSSGNWQTAAAPHVPVYRFNADAQQSSLTIFSRFLMVPETMSDWITIDTRGN